MNTQKHYSNYQEQVLANVKILDLANDIGEKDEEYFIYLFEAIDAITSNEKVISCLNTENVNITNLDEQSDKFYEYRDEYVRDMMDGVYQMFEVQLIGDKFTSEHERLCIFYSEGMAAYILPVFHFGTSWTYISPMGQ